MGSNDGVLTGSTNTSYLWSSCHSLTSYISGVTPVSTGILAFYIIWRILLYPNFFSPLRHLPRPRGASYFPFQWMRLFREPHSILIEEWSRQTPNEGLLCYRNVLQNEHVVPTSPKAVAEVLVAKNHDYMKPSNIRKILSVLLGNGLLVSEGNEHKMQRKNFMPAFAFRHIKNLYPLFWSKSQRLVNAVETDLSLQLEPCLRCGTVLQSPLESKSPLGVVDMANWTRRFSLDVIGLAALGQVFDSIQCPGSDLNQAYEMMFKPNIKSSMSLLISAYLPWLTIPFLSSSNADFSAARQCIREDCRKSIRRKKFKLQEKELADLDILSVALRDGKYKDEELIDQLMSFLAAGHETVNSALSWAIYVLSSRVDIQDHLRQQISAMLPNLNTDVVFDPISIESIPYLQAFISEVLRLYAPIPLNFREAITDTSILGQHIPKGTSIVIGIWATNRSETLWGPDAQVFNPDRWLRAKHSESGTPRSNYASQTFGHGPRSCIGQDFARAELACAIAALVQRFEIHEVARVETIDLKGDIVVGPKDLKVKMRRLVAS